MVFFCRFPVQKILQSDILVDNNKKKLEDENTFKNQKFGWYLCRGVILTKDNLAT
jgi:hypothetical protein